MEGPFEFSSPLCLENICRINLLFRLEEYPVQQLLLLPLSIRRDLYHSLSPVDVLHYEAAGLFHDFDTGSVVESARETLLHYTIGRLRSEIKHLVNSESILPSLVDEQQLQGLPMTNLLKHISESYSSLPITIMTEKGIVIIPNRFNSFLKVRKPRLIKLASPRGSRHINPLDTMLQYCHYLTAPKETIIDVTDFVSSSALGNCIDDDMYLGGGRKVGDESNFVVACDPFIPLMQSFMSKVETLELRSTMYMVLHAREYAKGSLDFNMDLAALCVLFYNIITAEQPCLQHVKMRGLRTRLRIMLTVVDKFSGDGSYDGSLSLYPLVLASAPPPYHLKGLSIGTAAHKHNYGETNRKEPDVRFILDSRPSEESVSLLTRSIVLFNINSLEHVTIDRGMDFCYRLSENDNQQFIAERNYMIPEYRELLSALTDLLKQPQLQSLSVGRAPLTEAYQMIKVFLCTETTHTQSLTIEGIEEESKWKANFIKEDGRDGFIQLKTAWSIDVNDEDGLQQSDHHAASDSVRLLSPSLVQPLPDSNGALKSLDIGCSCDRLHAWLFSIPNLQLKELKTSRPDLVPSSGVDFTVIDVGKPDSTSTVPDNVTE